MESGTLYEILAAQTAQLDQLSELLNRETSELSHIQVDAMLETNAEKEDLVREISRLSLALQQEISAAAVRAGLPSDAPLGAVTRYLAQSGHNELREKQKAMEESANRVKRAANLNLEIAERFASMTSDSLDLITRLVNQSNTYGASGGFQARPTGAVMINKEV